MLRDRWLCAWRVRLRMLFDRRRADRELEEELRHHVTLATEARRARGVPPTEARRQALVSLGGLESTRNHVRDARFAVALITSWQDLRFAARGLVCRPLASAVAVATLSLGLASVTVLFAVTDAVILQPIGDRDSRLVRIWKDDVERGGGLLFPISYPEYLVWKDEATGFDALAAINYADGATTAVLVDDEPVTANRVLASAGLLAAVGARPAHGRLLEPGDDVEGAALVAVVSHRFWRRVSGDPAFVGQRLRFPGDRPFTVVGVLQPDVTYPVDADIWLPLVPAFGRDLDAPLDSPRTRQFHVVGRLAPGVSIGQARSDLGVVHGRLSAEHPEDYPRMPIETDGVVTTRVYLPSQRYGTPDEVRAFYDRAVDAIERLPGVVSAAPYHLPPGTGTTGLSSPFQFEGQTPDESATNEWANWDIATPRYFETMGIPIVSGRAFARTDTADAQRVAVVSESAAARYWPGEEPIGKRVRISPRFEWATVVGVAADLRYRELTSNWMTVYFPAPQSFHFQPGNLAIRTGRPPSTLLSTIRDTIQAIEPSMPIDTLTPMDELLAAELARPRLAVRISIAFGLVTLALIAVGLFGTVSFDARQRRVEMAIRSALGASPHALRRLVAGRGLRIAAAGVVTGLAATALGTRALTAVLFNVAPLDPVTLAAVSGGLALLAVLACWIPARRAASTDPAEALRSGE